ncbi:hypothetical protein [Amycolatopsis sp. H20-H5]|uniref:hypothetical protein n=1 Tax=Amycolatopsis sp. H20-H5 TaxID=3046309 RepID=UPI002DB73CD8|nr:hypothetical protein [Amycolatopsis sp. H20-H5]MEC3974863.1 hypothetical protein [Amycolatopsis sp. H20-H5]
MIAVPSRAKLLATVEYLHAQAHAIHDMVVFLHRSEEPLQEQGLGFVVLAHEAGTLLLYLRDRTVLLCQYIDDEARKLPDI